MAKCIIVDDIEAMWVIWNNVKCKNRLNANARQEQQQTKQPTTHMRSAPQLRHWMWSSARRDYLGRGARAIMKFDGHFLSVRLKWSVSSMAASMPARMCIFMCFTYSPLVLFTYSGYGLRILLAVPFAAARLPLLRCQLIYGQWFLNSNFYHCTFIIFIDAIAYYTYRLWM